MSHPQAVPAPRARGRDLAPRTALPEPAAPRGKRLLPGPAPASPKIQLNGTGFSTNLSGRIQPCGADLRPCAAGNSQPVTSPACPRCWHSPGTEVPNVCHGAGCPTPSSTHWECPVEAAVSLQPRVCFFLEQFSQMRAIKTMGKWKVFVRELRWQRGKVLG